jgi:hypothetical protein
LCEEIKANTDAIHENNKQIIANTFAGNKDYENSSNKEFLNEVLAGNLAEETDKLYEDSYKDGKGMSDKEAQEAYAKAMGWDVDKTENKSGNKAVYYDAEGNEVGEISDETARKYLAQQEALKNTEATIKETSESISKLTMKER